MKPYDPVSAGKLNAFEPEVTRAQRPPPATRVQGTWTRPTPPSCTKSAWISSLITATPWRSASSAVRASSASVHTRPVGLWGEHSTRTFASGRASSRSSASSSPTGTPRSSRPSPVTALRKPSYVGVWTTTPSPSAVHIWRSWESWLRTDGP